MRLKPLTSRRGKNGSVEPNWCNHLERGLAHKIIPVTTANDSWKPVEKNSFVSQERRKNPAAARLFKAKTFRSKKKPPSRIELITAARILETCRPVMAA